MSLLDALGDLLKKVFKVPQEHILQRVGSLIVEKDSEMLSAGTCFLIRENIFTTNYHLYSGNGPAYVKFNDNMYNVSGPLYLNRDRDIAIALTDMKKDNMTGLTLDINFPEISSEVFVYGNPIGFEKSVSRGIISAIRPANKLKQGYNGNQNDQFLQFDASIDHGSSGSPIIDGFGYVVGMASSGVKGTSAIINFGIPSVYIKEAMDELEEKAKNIKKAMKIEVIEEKNTDNNREKVKEPSIIDIINKELNPSKYRIPMVFPEFGYNSQAINYAECITFLITAIMISDGNLSNEDMEYIDCFACKLIGEYRKYDIYKENLDNSVKIVRELYLEGKIKNGIINRVALLGNMLESCKGNKESVKNNIIKLVTELPKVDGQKIEIRKEMSDYIVGKMKI